MNFKVGDVVKIKPDCYIYSSCTREFRDTAYKIRQINNTQIYLDVRDYDIGVSYFFESELTLYVTIIEVEV